MDALVRWLDAKYGRRLSLSHDLNITRSAVTQMIGRDYINGRYIDKIHEITGIPHHLLTRKAGSGLSEKELEELDAIARQRDLAERKAQADELQSQIEEEENNG